MLVTAAIIEKEGRVLITQRPDDGRHMGGGWEFPGGKVEFGEGPRDCLEREILEELGIKIKARDLFEVSSHVYDGKKHIVLLGIRCDFLSGEIKKHDIKDYAWVSPKDFDKYDMVAADLVFVRRLLELH